MHTPAPQAPRRRRERTTIQRPQAGEATPLRGALRRGLDASQQPLFYSLLRTPTAGRGVMPRKSTLKFITGPDDAGRPCITVMMPGED